MASYERENIFSSNLLALIFYFCFVSVEKNYFFFFRTAGRGAMLYSQQI
jgi:hypothetical protein